LLVDTCEQDVVQPNTGAETLAAVPPRSEACFEADSDNSHFKVELMHIQRCCCGCPTAHSMEVSRCQMDSLFVQCWLTASNGVLSLGSPRCVILMMEGSTELLEETSLPVN